MSPGTPPESPPRANVRKERDCTGAGLNPRAGRMVRANQTSAMVPAVIRSFLFAKPLLNPSILFSMHPFTTSPAVCLTGMPAASPAVLETESSPERTHSPASGAARTSPS
ncbi:MAG: hypothetical protein PWR25_614 [Euryarchaeota archaeon]|nr:hypothetical protein [Euryarchaeota archaeon]